MTEKTKKKIRPNILDDINKPEKNIYCSIRDLTNESSVEIFFVNRMLEDLGFKDRHIKAKTSLKKLKISKGAKSDNYKPDYCIVLRKKPKLVVDAKNTEENLTDFTEQCAHYCLALNRKFEDAKPLEYFILSNGLNTNIYKWDSDIPIIELNFFDFNYGNPKYEELRNLCSYDSLKSNKDNIEPEQLLTLRKIDKEDAQKLFAQCHKYIWNAEDCGPSFAFQEFVKIIFLKLYHDRKLHEQYGDGEITAPKNNITFSTHWIDSREHDTINPINDLQFKNLLDIIEDDIWKNNKKRIFEQNEKIDLKPQTIKAVVKKLEKVDLYGIDEDLNGRLFETFLKATMRGKELGQFFTPRSIVLLATKLAELKASKGKIDTVMDACCGTGGFLIEALTEMRNQIRANQSYDSKTKLTLIEKLCNECLYGIDSAKSPPLARIARINMYLHGDGGGHIYKYDGLDNEIVIDKSESQEQQKETDDFSKSLQAIGGFDFILTNPPFSRWYELNNEDKARILKQYDIAKRNIQTNKYRSRVRSAELFLERYYRLLGPNGKLLTIIDETILSSPKFKIARNFIRNFFNIKAIISLHGDAFRMSGARVKTALIFLEKKEEPNNEQSSIFMYPSIYLGVDDLPVTTNKAKIEIARKKAEEEIKIICEEFKKYSDGKTTEWVVSPEKLKDRLDLKHCLAKPGRFVKKWKDKGYDVIKVSDIAKPIENILYPREKENADNEYRILTVSYAGRVRMEEIRKGKDIGYRQMKVVEKGDLVFSSFNSIRGAIGFVTEEFTGGLASGSYTVVRCENEFDTLYLWSILRSAELRSEMLIGAVGLGRQTIEWEDISKIQIPFPGEAERKAIHEKILKAWEYEKTSKEILKEIKNELNDEFNVDSEQSLKWFEANKPPK